MRLTGGGTLSDARGPLNPETHLAIEAVDGAHALRLVVAAREVHVLRVQPLVRKQRQDDLCTEGAPVHKIPCRHCGTSEDDRRTLNDTLCRLCKPPRRLVSPSLQEHTVEEVRLLRGRLAVQLKDVEQVIELAMDVSTYCERLSCGVKQGGRLDNDGDSVDDDSRVTDYSQAKLPAVHAEAIPVGTSTSTSVASDLRAASAPMTISNAKRTLIFFWSLKASSMLSTNCCVIL